MTLENLSINAAYRMNICNCSQNINDFRC